MPKQKTQEKIEIPFASLSMGLVELKVKDLRRMQEFYQEIMGLDLLSRAVTSLTFGKHKKPLLVLHEQKNLPRPHPSQAGLYHFAILFSSRSELARTIQRAIQNGPHFFAGSADHLVSEAFYFKDPEDNGIELYYDRDRSLWQWENGQVKMDSLYIDPNEYINRYITVEDPKAEISIGHVHLRVGNIEKARDFYVDKLGFSVTAELPHALFVSSGGYHHHIAMNSWESMGAVERNLSLGLKQFEIVLNNHHGIQSLRNYLDKHNIAFTQERNTLALEDPWRNRIAVRLANI